MIWYLLTWDRTGRTPLAIREYPAAARAEALAERRRLILLHAADPDVEVALIGAHGLDDLRALHGRYFVGAKKDRETSPVG